MLSQARLLTIILLSALLTACGGGGGSGSEEPISNSPSLDSQNSSSNSPPSSTETDSSTNTPPTPPSNSQTTITISWVAPSTRENGTPLPRSEISGYEIYYFREGSSEEEGEIITINDPNTLATQTPPLSTGRYYFAIATIDTQGIYSDTSGYVAININ